MTLHFRETPEKIIAFFSEAQLVDREEIQQVGNGLQNVCEQAARTGKRMVIDFAGVELLSSAICGVLVLLMRAALQHSVDLRLTHVGPNVLEVLTILRLHRVFRMDDEDTDPEGIGIPNPKPPKTLQGRAKPTSE